MANIETLLKNGVLDRTEEGRVVFPYDAIHVEFMITKAALTRLQSYNAAPLASARIRAASCQCIRSPV